MPSVRARAVLRVLLLVILSASAALHSWFAIDAVRDHYQDLERNKPGDEDKPQKDMVTNLAKQSETLLGWAVLALAGTVTLVISTKVRPTRGLAWVFICFGPGGVLLLASSYAGLIFQRRVAFMTSINNFADFGSLNALLNLQSEFFVYALAVFSLFAGFFLYRIVQGTINPSA